MKMRLDAKLLEAFDAQPYRSGEELRYMCPSRDCRDKPIDNLHRSLALRKDGVYHCFRCGMSGVLVDVLPRYISNEHAEVVHLPRKSLKELMR